MTPRPRSRAGREHAKFPMIRSPRRSVPRSPQGPVASTGSWPRRGCRSVPWYVLCQRGCCDQEEESACETREEGQAGQAGQAGQEEAGGGGEEIGRAHV